MTTINSIMESGNNGIIISVECSLSNSLPTIVVVGYTHRSIDEARERIRGALSTSGIAIPPKRITISLSPADIPKGGSAFDLPMLLAVLSASNMIKHIPSRSVIVLGEIGLHGDIRPIRGIIGKILAAKKMGITKFWIPEANLSQAKLIPGVYLLSFTNIKQLFELLNFDAPPRYSPTNLNICSSRFEKRTNNLAIANVIGQESAKRALTIAAAGQHNIMLVGPPGSGKSMLAKALPGLLPDLLPAEILEITHLHSLASKNYEQLIILRPFRAPHHNSSTTALLGGGSTPRPGEVSLSHCGVLFLDELPEFKRQVIEGLRQPLEDKTIRITRAKEHIEYPAHFIMVAAANSCPCGYFGSLKHCLCTSSQIINYKKKISGPILDRIDLFVEVESIPHRDLLMSHNIEISRAQSIKLKKQVTKARVSQLRRSKKLNSILTNNDLFRQALILPDSINFLNEAADKLNISSRSYIRCLRVARSIADIENSESVSREHVAEALQYRYKPAQELTSVV